MSPDDPLATCIRLRGAWSRTGEGLWRIWGLGDATRVTKRQLGGNGWSVGPSFWAHCWSPILSWRALISTDLGGAAVV